MKTYYMKKLNIIISILILVSIFNYNSLVIKAEYSQKELMVFSFIIYAIMTISVLNIISVFKENSSWINKGIMFTLNSGLVLFYGRHILNPMNVVADYYQIIDIAKQIV